MQYYPIYLNITNKRCVVVGGGDVGERKVLRLLECSAVVAVVSRDLTPSLKEMKHAGRIEHVDDDYDAAYLDGACMVIGATNRDEVNKKISADARGRGIIVNIADDPARCDFILPSLVRQGELVIALSTGGKSPALARKLRKELEASFGPEYAVFLAIMGNLRERIIAGGRSQEENRKIFEALVNSDILFHIKEGNWEGVTNCIQEITGVDVKLTGKEAKDNGCGERDGVNHGCNIL